MNAQLPVYYCLGSDTQASGSDALTMNWDTVHGYAFPPIALIPRVLRKLLRHPSATIVLIAPFWPSQIWFRQMTNLLVDLPRVVPDRWNLLKNSAITQVVPGARETG